MNKKDYKKLAKKLNDFEYSLYEEYGFFTSQQADNPRHIIIETALLGLPISDGQELWVNNDNSRFYLVREGEEWTVAKDES